MHSFRILSCFSSQLFPQIEEIMVQPLRDSRDHYEELKQIDDAMTEVNIPQLTVTERNIITHKKYVYMCIYIYIHRIYIYSSNLHFMNLQLERQRTTQELPILRVDEHPENYQGQQPWGRRGVRIHGGRVQRQNRGRNRRGQEQRCISDEIRATIVDRVVNHGLTMAEGCS